MIYSRSSGSGWLNANTFCANVVFHWKVFIHKQEGQAKGRLTLGAKFETL